jgi:hypothetical protein
MYDMKRVAGLVLVLGFVGIMALVASCRKDVMLVEPDTIKGDYIGTFTYKIGSQVAEEQFVTWRFTDYTFNMWYDEDRDIDENGEGAAKEPQESSVMYRVSIPSVVTWILIQFGRPVSKSAMRPVIHRERLPWIVRATTLSLSCLSRLTPKTTLPRP